MYKRVWKIELDNYGFKSVILVRGTEDEMRDYIDSELNGVWKHYIGASEAEVKAAEVLGIPVYLAPDKH